MARIARVVAPGLPHHVTQRGNRRQTTFFTEDDYCYYLALLQEWSSRHNVLVWAYCLMPNHIHLIVVPQSEDGLRQAIGETHRRYSRRINFRMGWRGHLWQGRFSSYPMDETYLLAATRYVERNPLVAGLVSTPEDYPWSSTRHYLGLQVDPLIRQSPLSSLVSDWRNFLVQETDRDCIGSIKKAERTGRPLGNGHFISQVEVLSGRVLRRGKPGPKPKVN